MCAAGIGMMYKCSKTGVELAHPETRAELEKELAKSSLDEGSQFALLGNGGMLSGVQKKANAQSVWNYWR